MPANTTGRRRLDRDTVLRAAVALADEVATFRRFWLLA